MHKQKAVLAKAVTVRPGDKIPFGGRGPWPRVEDVRPFDDQVEIVTKRGTLAVPAAKHIRTVRNARR